MRVFCHEHKRGFFAPRQSPIKCENRGHVLGELDFAGQQSRDNSPFPLQWEYCCNCEHFCVINFEESGLDRCPVCTRRTSTLYLCDRCYTISFESNTPLDTKNFTLTSEGVPSPCCPGCLHPASADLHEHVCDDAKVSLVTALNTCPLCNERLDVGPSFPATVAQYLKRTKSANKTFVTLDYECGLFVPVEDGEFVLIRNNDESNKSFVLPRAPRLNSLRDFYELYQDYYHCAAPEAGEITISEPAVVLPVSEGWKLLSPGVFVLMDEQLKKPIAAAVAAPQPEVVRDPTIESDGSSLVRKTPPSETGTRCTYCDTVIEAKYAFCWKCGSARSDSVKASGTTAAAAKPVRSRLIVQAIEEDDAESQTVQHEKRASLLDRRETKGRDWLTQSPGEPSMSQRRSVLKLFAIAVVGLLLISLAILVMRAAVWSSSPETVQAATTQQAAQSGAPVQSAEPTPSAEMKPVTLKAQTTDVPDLALEQLAQMRRNNSDHSKILKNLSETEMKYANDYRFPYERARVVAIDHKRNFHEEAFAALTRAAQKAINSGKSNEMLQSLNQDSDGDFQKLSHGHREWVQLQRALKSRNANVLSVNEGL